MDFVDLKSQYRKLQNEILSGVNRVLEHGQYILGPEVYELERELSSYTNTLHCISCASGTDALLISLMALDVGPGDVVFTTPFTFISTAEVISRTQALPVFVDVDPRTYTIDPIQLGRAIEAVRARDHRIHPLPAPLKAGTSAIPKAVITVDLFGMPADYDELRAIAKKNGLPIIEDAAQSFGASYRNTKAGAITEIGCTSFFPAKPLGCYGDGGAIFTSDDQIAQKMRSIRVHGQGKDKYDNIRPGLTSRLDSIQAAVLLAKLPSFDAEIRARQEAADRYANALAKQTRLQLPWQPIERRSAWAQYSVLAENPAHRDFLRDQLTHAGIPTGIYYPTPLHQQPVYRSLEYSPGSFPVSESLSGRIFSLPMHPFLTEAEIKSVAQALHHAEAKPR